MNPSLSEDSVADTAISKRNSDGTSYQYKFIKSDLLTVKNRNLTFRGIS